MTEFLRAGRVDSCDAHGLQSALVAATTWVELNAERINAMNVFPVPDGDTGSNMWLTLQSAVAEANGLPAGSTAGAIAHAASHGALMGARGNSGVILSQILRGFARGLDDLPTFTAPALAAAFSEGAATAYRAVIKPVEGTILTVARESAKAAEIAASGGSDIVETLAATVSAAYESLARTPTLLPVLAEAGVVDAGGQGYLTFVEGMLRYFRGESDENSVPTGMFTSVGEIGAEDPYGYCTEFIIKGEALNIDAVRAEMIARAESVLVVGDDSVVRVHLHTFDPGAVLSVAVQHGTLHRIKIDNMQEQHREFLLTGQLELSPAPPKPIQPHAEQEAAPEDEIALVVVASGDGLGEVFRSLGATSVVPGGQTMNPSTGELLKAVEGSPAQSVILLPNNANIVLTAQQVVPLSKKRLVVVPTRTIPQGIAALMAYNYEAGFESNAASMERASESIKTVEVTFAVRTAKVDGVNVEEGDAIALVDGQLVTTGYALSEVAMTALAHAGVDRAELVTLYLGDGTDRQAAEQLRSEIQKGWPGCAVEVVDGGQPHYPYIISVE